MERKKKEMLSIPSRTKEPDFISLNWVPSFSIEQPPPKALKNCSLSRLITMSTRSEKAKVTQDFKRNRLECSSLWQKN